MTIFRHVPSGVAFPPARDVEKCRPPRRLIILKFLFGERSRARTSDSPVQLIMNFCRPQSIFPGNEIAGKLASLELMSNYASGLSVVVPRRWGSRWALFVFRGLLSSKGRREKPG